MNTRVAILTLAVLVPQVRAAIRPDTALVIMESPGNPTLALVDIADVNSIQICELLRPPADDSGWSRGRFERDPINLPREDREKRHQMLETIKV